MKVGRYNNLLMLLNLFVKDYPQGNSEKRHLISTMYPLYLSAVKPWQCYDYIRAWNFVLFLGCNSANMNKYLTI